jgi:hypothetical protein
MYLAEKGLHDGIQKAYINGNIKCSDLGKVDCSNFWEQVMQQKWEQECSDFDQK